MKKNERFIINNKNEFYAYHGNRGLVFFTRKLQKKAMPVLRNNIPVKRIVRHLYACHRNDEIDHFLEIVSALKGGEPIIIKFSKGLFCNSITISL